MHNDIDSPRRFVHQGAIAILIAITDNAEATTRWRSNRSITGPARKVPKRFPAKRHVKIVVIDSVVEPVLSCKSIKLGPRMLKLVPCRSKNVCLY